MNVIEKNNCLTFNKTAKTVHKGCVGWSVLEKFGKIGLRFDMIQQHWTGLDWTGLDRTGQDRTGQDRTGQDRTGRRLKCDKGKLQQESTLVRGRLMIKKIDCMLLKKLRN